MTFKLILIALLIVKNAKYITNLSGCLSNPCLNGGSCNDYGSNISCTCGFLYTGTFCENYIYCTTATILYDLSGTRDIEYKNTSVANNDDSTLKSGWYFFGFNRQFPTSCPLSGSCTSLMPYWTLDTQPDETYPGLTNITLCASNLDSSSASTTCTLDCTMRVLSVYCFNLNMTIYNLSTPNMPGGRYCYETRFDPFQTTTSITTSFACSSNPCRNGGTCSHSLYGSISCVCPPQFVGLFCENHVSCLNAKPIPTFGETRDVKYMNKSYPNLKDENLTLDWYYFGKDKTFPNVCQEYGSCASTSPYCTTETQPDENNPYLKDIMIFANAYVSPGLTFTCPAIKISSVYCYNLNMTIYYLNVSSCGRYCYESQTNSLLNSTKIQEVSTTTTLSSSKTTMDDTLNDIQSIVINETKGLDQNETLRIIEGLNIINIDSKESETVNTSIKILDQIAEVLTNLTNRRNVNVNDIQNAVKIIDTTVNLNRNLLENSQRQLNTSSRIINSIDNLFTNVITDESIAINSTSLIGLSLNMKDSNSSLYTVGVISNNEKNDLTPIKQNVTNQFERASYGAYLDKEIISQLNQSNLTTRFSIVVHLNPKLFETARSSLPKDQSNARLSPQIMTVNSNLDLKPVDNKLITMIFSDNNSAFNPSYKCVFWDYQINNWNTYGCEYSYVNKQHTCTCNHTTNFAMLILIDENKNQILPPGCSWCENALLYSSITGSCLSIIFLSISFVVYLVKRLRLRKSNSILFTDYYNHKLLLCVNLLLLNVFYLVFSQLNPKSTNKDACASIGILLHYFLLSSFFVMFFSLLKNYLMIDRLLSKWVQNFIFFTLISQLLSLLIVITAIVVPPSDVQKYASETRCWLNGLNVVYFVIIPVVITLLGNITLLVLIFSQKTRKYRKNKYRSSKCPETNITRLNQEQLELLKLMVLSLLTSGLAWLFGFLIIIPYDDNSPWQGFIFSLLFCLFNTLQGFVYVFFSGLLTYCIQSHRNAQLKTS